MFAIWQFYKLQTLPRFSDSVAHIVRYFTKKQVINYLDDYLFAALVKALCNGQVSMFLKVCAMINFPVALEKTFWGTTTLTFLGLLIDTVRQVVCIPYEKVQRALNLIEQVLQKKSKKITVHQLQKLCGFLNFLCRAVILEEHLQGGCIHIQVQKQAMEMVNCKLSRL